MFWPGFVLAKQTVPGDWQQFMALRGHTMITGKNGPAVRYATTIAEDRQGRIWVGDYAGLTRLEGDRVHRYVGMETPGMAEGYTLSLLPLANGDMLVGGDREGVLYWEQQRDAFVPVVLPDGSQVTRVSALVAARQGGAWAATEQGLYYWPEGARALQPMPVAGLESTRSTRIFDVHEAADGTLWLAAQPGLYRLPAGQTTWLPVALEDPRLQSRLMDEPAWRLRADPQGRLWVGMMRSGVVVIEPDTGKAFAPAGLDGQDGIHGGSTIRSLLWEPSRGGMWAGTDGKGLFFVSEQRSYPQPVNLNQFMGGPNFHVRSLIRARNGRIWAATDRGAFHFDPEPTGLMELDATPPGQGPYEQPHAIWSLHVDRQGRLWLGYHNGMVQVLDPHTGKRHVIHLPAPFSASHIVAMGRDSRGRVWLAGNGLVRVDEKTLTVLPPEALAQLPVRRLTGMAIGRDRVWISHNEGLLELDLDGRVVRRMDDARQGLRTTRLATLGLEWPRLWVGSAAGLHVVDLLRWQARVVDLDPRFADGNRDMYRDTASLLVTSESVWTGTLGGISRVEPGVSASLQRRLPTHGKEVRALLSDGAGGVFYTLNAPSDKIGWLDANGRQRSLGLRSGLHQDTAVYVGAMTRTHDGWLAIGSNGGVIMVDPAMFNRLSTSAPDLSPRLLSIHLDGTPLAVEQLPAHDRPLQLGREVERVVMAFSAMDYIGSDLRHYSYRLEGFDSRWIDAGNGAPLVFYSTLPPGRYALLLRTTSEEYPGKEWITRIPVVVPAAWYERPGLWVVMVVVLLLGVAILVDRKLQRGQRREQRLQKLVGERTEELERVNQHLLRLASEDALTGLLSRGRIMERLDELLARRRRVPGRDVVIMLDLDHFKQINDTHGHLAGDAVLREVALRLRRELRDVDMAARYGGEELLIVLPDTDVDQGRRVAERLATALRAVPVFLNDGTALHVHASLGVALLDAESGVDDALSRADAALYRAKGEGRDRVCVDGSAMERI